MVGGGVVSNFVERRSECEASDLVTNKFQVNINVNGVAVHVK